MLTRPQYGMRALEKPKPATVIGGSSSTPPITNDGIAAGEHHATVIDIDGEQVFDLLILKGDSWGEHSAANIIRFVQGHGPIFDGAYGKER